MKVFKQRFIASFIFALFAGLVLCSAGFAEVLPKNDWELAKEALSKGDREESLKFLRICSFSGDHVFEAERLLRDVLASQSSELLKGRPVTGLAEYEKNKLFDLFNEICGLKIADSIDWYNLLAVAAAMSNNEKLEISGQKFLDRLRNGLKADFDEDWIKILKKLYPLFSNDWQILYRWQLSKILAENPLTSNEYKIEYENSSILAQTKARAVLNLAEVSMAIGDIETAKQHLDQVRFFNREFPELDKMYIKLKKVGEIQRLLAKAKEAMNHRDFNLAANFCKQVIKIDANNIFAKDYLKQIEEAKTHKPGKTLTSADRVLLKLRGLELELKKAERENDLLLMQAVLRDILQLRSEVKYIKKLEEVTNEILASRIHAEERFVEAQKLFEQGDYEKLRLFLNRNPGLMSSMDRMVNIWEMKLMVNYYSGKMGPIELRNSAENILKKGGKSFYAYFVLMNLALSENRMEEAKTHYLAAMEMNPDFPGLRWPGWLIWMHGDGRAAVVIVLIIVLLLMIKLLRPVICWYESTYWTRVRLLSAIFPSLAMRSLEKCFGTVNDSHERREMFQLLIKCCQKNNNQLKGLKYAENLLDISPDNQIAIDAIGAFLIKQPEVSPDKFPLLIRYAMNNQDNSWIFEKLGHLIKSSNQIKPEQIEFLTIYSQKFPQDIAMFSLIGKCFLEIPASELPDSATVLLETAWKATDSDELWWNLWRTLMVKGKFELAIKITEEALSKGKPIEVDKLIEVFDREQFGVANAICDQLNSFDDKVVIKAAHELLTVKYFNEQTADQIGGILERLLNEENQELAASARQAYDYIKARACSTASAIRKLLSVASDVSLVSEKNDNLSRTDTDAMEGTGSVAGSLNSDEQQPQQVEEQDFLHDEAAFGKSEILQENREFEPEAQPGQEYKNDGEEFDLFGPLSGDSGDDKHELSEPDEQAMVHDADILPELSNEQSYENDFSDTDNQLQDSECNSASETTGVDARKIDDAPFPIKETGEKVLSEFDEIKKEEIQDEELSDNELEATDNEDIEDEPEEGLFSLPKGGAGVEYRPSPKEPVGELAENDYVPEDYADYIVGSSEENSVGFEKVAPDDYSDYLIGTSADNQVEEIQEKKVPCFCDYENVPEYTLEEVKPEEIEEVFVSQTLPDESEDSKILERRKQLFGTLDEYQPPPEPSPEYRKSLLEKPVTRLFSELEDIDKN
ncbi:MAG: hypothetical protein Kow0029_03590 [Candidatus Rifleibacteriota bacterium]